MCCISCGHRLVPFIVFHIPWYGLNNKYSYHTFVTIEGFSHWTRVHCEGKRYNIMDSNIAESWNQVLKEAREYPLICMLEYIRTCLMDWFALRRARADRSISILSPRVRKMVEDSFEEAMTMVVRPISEYEFQVQSTTGECFAVRLVEGSCTCNVFQALGIPCSHVVAAATRIGMSVDSFVAGAYFEETLRLAYAEKIYPIPSVGDPSSTNHAAGTTSELHPPNVRRPPGRPKKIRILSRGEFKVCVQSTYI